MSMIEMKSKLSTTSGTGIMRTLKLFTVITAVSLTVISVQCVSGQQETLAPVKAAGNFQLAPKYLPPTNAAPEFDVKTVSTLR